MVEGPDYTWKLVYHDGSSFTDRDGEPSESPDRPVLFVVEPGKRPNITGINAAWIMWRRDRERWTECGDNGFSAHARVYGHLIGCWRETMWILKPDFEKIWRMAREELGE